MTDIHTLIRRKVEALEAENKRLREIVQAFIDETVDYATRNNLGDPEKQHNVKWARAELAGRRQEE